MSLFTNCMISSEELVYWTIGTETGQSVTRSTSEAAWQEYQQLRKKNAWLKALMVMNRLLDFDHEQPEAWRIKARLHGVLGHSTCCMAAIVKLLNLVPDDLDALKMQTLYYYCHLEHSQALEICDFILGKTPSEPEIIEIRHDIISSMAVHN